MRKLVWLLFLLTTLAAAKDRVWKDAVFLGMTSDAAGAAAMPIGNIVVAVPLSGRTYWFKSGGITYALATNYTGRWPNLTVNGHAKIAIEGRTAHVLDEDNKDRKFSILEKIAPKEQQ
jgi:hypothetical protein